MIKFREVKYIKTGMLCKVIKKDTHLISQYDDCVIVKGLVRSGTRLVEGINLKTLKRHHYAVDDLREIYV